ncbi:MAG: acyl carrier protein [Spirochaetae bacterium HGW-Spirochaetae-1]|jgi:acyl carrier protein|nr:MAG: acyl carrier protein [Spirochaetae bacterium HGW-Spirochaetae-1]
MDIFNKVKNIIIKQLNIEEENVTKDASFIEDLGADSIDSVELIMAFEVEFNIEIPEEDAERLQTVDDVVKYIQDRI